MYKNCVGDSQTCEVFVQLFLCVNIHKKVTSLVDLFVSYKNKVYYSPFLCMNIWFMAVPHVEKEARIFLLA